MLAARATADELMDADDLAPETYAAVMRDLTRVNAMTLARRPTLGFLRRLTARRRAAAYQDMRASHPDAFTITIGRTDLRVLDVGFGSGDMLRAMVRWSSSNWVRLGAVGIDLNPRSAPAARAATPTNVPAFGTIDYRTGDYADLAGQGWDAIVSSLVAHHMTRAQLVAFIAFMEREASGGWLINDLHRHGFAWLGYGLLARLMRWHPIVRHDGRLSIARSYRPHEWPSILAEAGVDARVYRAFPFRLCVERLR